MGKKKRKGRMEGGGPGLQEESGLCISDAESSFSPLFFFICDKDGGHNFCLWFRLSPLSGSSKVRVVNGLQPKAVWSHLLPGGPLDFRSGDNLLPSSALVEEKKMVVPLLEGTFLI